MRASDQIQIPAAEVPPPAPQAPVAVAGAELSGQLGAGVTVAGCVILLLAIAVIDKLTGYGFRLRILHMVPIVIVAWVAGRNWSLLLAAAAIAIWIATHRGVPGAPPNYLVFWDGFVAFAVYALVCVVIARLREELQCAQARFVAALDVIEAPAFVVDVARGEVLYGNRPFREAHAGLSWQELSALPARESGMRWFNTRPVILRVLTGK